MDKSILIQELKILTNDHHIFFKKLLDIQNEDLLKRKNSESWNALEVTEHLKRYGDFYIPVLEKALLDAPTSGNNDFSSGWLGNYFANAMKPGSAKMNTFKSKNPLGESISSDVIFTFINQLEKLSELLELCRYKNLSKIKVKTTIPVVKINAGDALKVVIYHNDRHVSQIKQTLEMAEKTV